MFRRPEPEYIENNDLLHAYKLYLYGFNTLDPTMMRLGLDYLEDNDARYLDVLEKDTEQLRRRIADQNADYDVRFEALSAAVISYAYSGLKFDTNVPTASIMLLGSNPDTMSHAVKPTKSLLIELKPQSYEEEVYLRKLGNAAFTALHRHWFDIEGEVKKAGKRMKSLKSLQADDFMLRSGWDDPADKNQ